jgi:14-3-3 protein epsilon
MTRHENVFMATLTEQAERYDNMADHMKQVAQMGSDLNLAERNLLSVAYKNAVGCRRQAWRAVNTFEQQGPRGPVYAELANKYRKKIEDEMHEKCTELLQLLRDDLIPKSTAPDATVFYNKLKGDYLRYLSEFSTGEHHSRCAQEAHDAYQQASDVALSRLPPTSPIRLGLALNFSVFYYEVFSAPEKACLLAKAAFNDAMTVMDQLSTDDYADSSTILQLLRDNLTLWTADMRQEPEAMKMDDAD